MGAELDERGRRLWAATEASELGHKGILAVSRATGLTGRTIRRGCQELLEPPSSVGSLLGRRRRPGGGRRSLQAHDPELVAALEALVEPSIRGDPMSPLRWTCKSTRKLAKALTRQGHPISHSAVAHLLAALDYSLQETRKTQEGGTHPDRDAQFHYINQQAKRFQKAGQPVISVDAKKHEVIVQLIGNTTTDTGLTIQAELDHNLYPTGVEISDQQMQELNLSRAKFHGKDWNYTIKPR